MLGVGHPVMKHYRQDAFSNINQGDNFSYERSVFVDCTFLDCTSEGAQIDSTFVSCIFSNHDWYWCTGHSPIFVNCLFSDCDLRGSFYSASFIGCTFKGCRTGANNLGGKTEWTDCIVTDCVLIDTSLPLSNSTDIEQWPVLCRHIYLVILRLFVSMVLPNKLIHRTAV